MLRFSLATASLLLGFALPAQTTGVVGVNDLQMLLPPTYVPTGSGTVSCSTFVTTGAVGTNSVGFLLNAPGATSVWLLVSPLGCVPNYFPFLPSATAGCAGPPAGTPLTNLWLSLVAGGPWPFAIPGQVVLGALSRWSFTLTWPIPPLYFQGFMLDPCSPTTFKFSQAMGFQ